MTDQTLTVADLSKKFCRSHRRDMRYAVADILGELVPRGGRIRDLRRDEFWVLDGISFELRRGEALGVIGRNGVGKTTLLKLLFGLIKPDRGTIRVNGRVEAVLELGAGFNPILTGRENVQLGAALHGLHGASARALLDRVVAFAELEAAIDAPVQTLSSGMRARLAFSLAAHLEPDILLVDEALSVGDISFQRKCMTRMREFLNGGGSLLFVSHSAYQVQALCNRGILIEGGKIAYDGDPVTALNLMVDLQGNSAEAALAQSATGPVTIDAVVIEYQGDVPVTNQPADVIIRYRSTAAFDVLWSFFIMSGDQWVCIAGAISERATAIRPGPGELRCRIERFPVLPGNYVVRVGIADANGLIPLAALGWEQGGVPLRVGGRAEMTQNIQAQLGQLTALEVTWPADAAL